MRLQPSHAVILTRLLHSGPTSLAKLQANTGLSGPTITRWLKNLRDENYVYVAGYGPDARGRMFTPLYAWGNQPDAARPGRSGGPAA
jgi:DNA-binding transcriptional ArsR family regulator